MLTDFAEQDSVIARLSRVVFAVKYLVVDLFIYEMHLLFKELEIFLARHNLKMI